MKKELKLEERNVENTNPIELKKLHNENFDRMIKGFEGKREFSIVSFVFFTLVSILMYVNPIIVDAEFALVPSIIAFVFSLAIIVFDLYVKDKLMQKRMTIGLLEL